MEEKIGMVEKGVEVNRVALKDLEKRVESISEELKKRDEKVTSVVREGERSIHGELREREARRLNVVFHRIGEMEGGRAKVSERQDWDRKSCSNIFQALKLSLSEESIKFCRRVGEKGTEPRPPIIRFYT
jgi:hypothetical protein